MKKAVVILAALLLSAVSLFAQSVFGGSKRTEYTITESTSLGGGVTISNSVVTSSTGNVAGLIQFNSKAKTIKVGDRKINYSNSDLKTERFDNSCLTSGKAQIANNGGEVVFQIIENYEKNTINMLIQWPDYSAVKVMAAFKASKEVK